MFSSNLDGSYKIWKEKMSSVFCVLKDGTYYGWSENPFEYDAIFKDKKDAIEFCKEHEHGVVHKLTYRSGRSTERYTCDTSTYFTSCDTEKEEERFRKDFLEHKKR